MVQYLLRAMREGLLRRTQGRILLLSLLVLLVFTPAYAGKHQDRNSQPRPPDLLLEGGRKLSFERSLTSEQDVRGKPGFWTRLVDFVAGPPEYKQMVRPYGVAVDSRGRVIVSDPGITGIHVFDPAKNKYKFLQHGGDPDYAMVEPQCVAVDAKDNIYVTDSKAGKVFVFDAEGKYRGVFGNLPGGEGFFKRPTGIAIDPETQQIYVSDTLRDRIYVLDPDGTVLRTIGQRGQGDGEFRYPTELLMKDGILAVVDAMNFRVQMFGRQGNFLAAIGDAGNAVGYVFRPKGIGLDSEGHIYLVEGAWGRVQVFDREGRLLYLFGNRGTRLGEFQLPSGLFIDRKDRVYVVDSFNRRVQIFQYHSINAREKGGGR